MSVSIYMEKPKQITSELTESQVEVEIRDSPSQFTGYANINRIILTPEEAIFHYGLRDQKDPSQSDGVAKIYLSISHAKRIAIALTQVLRDYELMFGEILPDAGMRVTKEGQKRIEEALRKRAEEMGQPNVGDNK